LNRPRSHAMIAPSGAFMMMSAVHSIV